MMEGVDDLKLDKLFLNEILSYLYLPFHGCVHHDCVHGYLILHKVFHVRKSHSFTIFTTVFRGDSDEVGNFCEPAVHPLFRCSVLSIVDVETEGAGGGEGQVGDDGHHVHPRGPWDVLGNKNFEYFKRHNLSISKPQ